MRPYEQVRIFCAMAAHEINRVYCRALGDLSQEPWDTAPLWQQTSALKGVDGVFAGNGPEKSHESWLADKAAEGWKWGPSKDFEAKTHPCFLPYHELPPEQKHKDFLFVSTVYNVAASLGHPVPGAAPNLGDHTLQVEADRFSVKTRPA